MKIVNQDPFANPTFRHHFDKAHAENLAHHLPAPPTVSAPEPERGRKTWDTRRNLLPNPSFEGSCS